MVVRSKPLLALTASDLMSRDVVLLPQEMSVRWAADKDRSPAPPRYASAPIGRRSSWNGFPPMKSAAT